MRPRSTRFTGISGSRTVFSASSTTGSNSSLVSVDDGRSSSCAPQGGTPPLSLAGAGWFWNAKGSSSTDMVLLGLHRLAGRAVLQRCLESVPGECRAFDTRRIRFDAFERRQALEIVL